MTNFFSKEILEHIAACHPPNGEIGRIFAFGNLIRMSGLVLNLCTQVDNLNVKGDWNNVWELYLPLKIRCFIWLVKHEKLLTNCERVRRHMTDDMYCSVCKGVQETIHHVLCDYQGVAEAWLKVLSLMSV